LINKPALILATWPINVPNIPTALHELAVECIAGYLLVTYNRGIIFHPEQTFCLGMYVADIAGAWHQEH
jgi:hypothetical protein